MLNIIERIMLMLRKPKKGVKIIIAHRDVDGISCAAIALRALKEAQVIFTGPSKIIKVLKRLNVKDSFIIIADISINPKYGDFLSILKKLRKQGNKILWIDHHAWDSNILKHLRHLAKTYIRKSPSAARIAYEVLAPDDAISEKIASIADDADTGKYSLMLSRAYKVASKRRASRLKLLNKLRKGVFEDEDVKKWIEIAKEDYKISEKLARSIRIYTGNSGLRFGLIDIRRMKGSGSEAARIAMRNYNLSFVVVVRRNGRVSFYCRDPKINLLKIAMKYGGGGHPQACGFRLNLRERILSIIMPHREYRFIKELRSLV